MAQHPLDSPRAKLTRGAQTLQALKEHADRVQSNRMTLEAKYVEGAHAYDIVITTGRYPPLFLGLILGDYVHNLRSALDHLAWQLVAKEDAGALENQRTARKILFPIYNSEDGFTNSEVVKHVGAAAQDRMARFQPFRNTQQGTHLVNPLGILQALSNADKHRVLIPAVGKIEIDNIVVRSSVELDLDGSKIPVENASLVGSDTPIYRLPVLGERSDADVVEVRLTVPPAVEFPVPEIGMLRLDQLSGLLEQITEVVEAVGETLGPADDFEERAQSWITPSLDS
jgi:hypothetical protein